MVVVSDVDDGCGVDHDGVVDDDVYVTVDADVDMYIHGGIYTDVDGETDVVAYVAFHVDVDTYANVVVDGDTGGDDAAYVYSDV